MDSNVLWIRDLIDQKGQKWNIPVIENVFLSYDSQLILQISFDSLDQEDTIMWTQSKKWKLHGENKILLFFYILKRREILVALLKRMSLVFAKSFETPKPFRELRLYWCILHKTIPVGFKLNKKGINFPLYCPICRSKEESLNHIFISCDWTKKVWFESMLNLNFNGHKGQINGRLWEIFKFKDKRQCNEGS